MKIKRCGLPALTLLMASQLMKPSLDFKFCKEEKKTRVAKLGHEGIGSGSQDKTGTGPLLTVVVERGLHPVGPGDRALVFPKENEQNSLVQLTCQKASNFKSPGDVSEF